MKKILKTLTAVMLILAIMVPVFATAESKIVGKDYYITTSNGSKVNLRSATSTDSESVITVIPYGTKLTVYEWVENGKWAMVEYNGRLGYCMSRFLSETKPVAKKTENAATDESTFAAGNPPRSLDISLRSNPAAGYAWNYETNDNSVVTVVENGFYADQELLGSSGYDTFRLDGVKAGFATVTFNYTAPVQDEAIAIYTVTYTLEVDEHLDVNIYDVTCSF